jgi:hypothetical protein
MTRVRRIVRPHVRPCDGCGEIVGAAEVEHDIDVDGAIVLRLHPECFSALLGR